MKSKWLQPEMLPSPREQILTHEQKERCHLSRVTTTWMCPSAQSASPDISPKHKKHKPTVSLEKQDYRATDSHLLPCVREDLCPWARSAKRTVCLNSRTISSCVPLLLLSSAAMKKLLLVSLCVKVIVHRDDMRMNLMSIHCLQGPLNYCYLLL